MEAMNLVEVVLQNEHDDNDGGNQATAVTDDEKMREEPGGIKGLLDSSVTITVTRTSKAAIKEAQERRTGKPASFALMSPVRNGIRSIPREDLVCKACERVFKYKAAFLRHEAQCGHPVIQKPERVVLEERKAEKAAEAQRRKEEEKLPELRCPSCLKQFHDNTTFNSHDFEGCAAERATYTFVCETCKARFKYKNHLRRHEDSHNNVRRYECEVCTTAFLRPDHLKRHMMRMHGIVRMPTPNAPVKRKKKRSPGARAVRSSDEPVARKTTKNAPMECPMCSKVLSRRDHVLRHMRNVHHMNYSGSRAYVHKSLSGELDASDTLRYEDLTQGHGDYGMEGSMEGDAEDDGSEYLSMSEEMMTGEEDESSQQSSGLNHPTKAAIKEECPSPSAEDKCDTTSNEERDQNDNDPADAKEEIRKESDSFSLVTVKNEPTSPGGDGLNGDSDKTKTVDPNSWHGDSPLNSTSKISTDSGDSGTVSKSSSAIVGLNKPCLKSTSDGNQNVVSNGMVPGPTGGGGEDWISDLVNSGW